MATMPPANSDMDTGSGTGAGTPASAAPLAIIAATMSDAEMIMLRIFPFLFETAPLLATQTFHGSDRDNPASQKRHRDGFRDMHCCARQGR